MLGAEPKRSGGGGAAAYPALSTSAATGLAAAALRP
jgi:hypothetical protein